MLLFLLTVFYLFLVLVRPQEYPAMTGISIPFLSLTLMAAFAVWLMSRNKRFDAPQYLLLVLFLLVTCLSMLFSGWAGGAALQFLYFYPAVIAFLLLANAVDTPERMEILMTVFVSCAVLLAAHGIEQAALGVGWTGMKTVEDGRIQYLGIFSDPNDLGMLFVLSVPMAIYLSSRGGMLGLRRVFWLAACAALLYGIFLTNSRGGMLAVVAMAGVYLWLRRGAVIAGTLGACALVVLKMLPSRLNELDVQESSAAGRVDAWYEGFQMFLSNPVLGVGTHRFTEYHHLTAHNSLILVLAENGIIGFTIWIAFVGYGFLMMYRILRHEPELVDDEHAEEWAKARAIAQVLMISLSGFFATAFFLSRSYIILLYLVAAIVVAHFSIVRDRFPEIEPFRLSQDLLRWPIYSAIAVAGLYVVVRGLLAMG